MARNVKIYNDSIRFVFLLQHASLSSVCFFFLFLMYKSGGTEIWLLSVILTALFSLHLGNIFGVCGIFYWSVVRFGVFREGCCCRCRCCCCGGRNHTRKEINERVVSYSRAQQPRYNIFLNVGCAHGRAPHLGINEGREKNRKKNKRK